MPDTPTDFDSLPDDYQDLLQLAGETHGISISPLQELVGGWSGAYIYLVRVVSRDTGRVEHLILKLDRKNPLATSDESTRHQTVLDKSPPVFSEQHIPRMVFPPVEQADALAIFYAIAGQSLRRYRTLSSHGRQRELEILFSKTNRMLLETWNGGIASFEVQLPQALLQRWLGFRLDLGQKIARFLRNDCLLDPLIPGFIISGRVFPNPLYFAHDWEAWGPVRQSEALTGLQHGDLNTNNILAKFTPSGEAIEGFYLIDFALFKENMPLFYDQRYLEISFLVHALQKTSLGSTVDLIVRLADRDVLSDAEAPVDLAGVNAAIRAGRLAFKNWLQAKHPSLHDDLWGQYWLAGAAAGLAYCHKDGQPFEVRLAGMIYAAANLKRFFNLYGLEMPSEAGSIYPAGHGKKGSEGRHARPRHNLPAPATQFIGRETELSDLADLLQTPETRLVTLTGPGGTGKTRLALETGRALQDRFSHGVFFVDLAAIRDPALVATTTAHAVGIREGGSRPSLENLKDYLANRKILLIFDNFEQVTGAASTISDLLASAPGLKALITSRIPLRLKGEREYPVDSLALPPDASLPPEELGEYEAVALFRQQARAVRPGFELTKENREIIVDIVRRLDGLPLAIEIAAARIKMLPPRALRKRLDDRLTLLVGGARDLPERQQTLRSTIDWSFDLLTAEEQQLFTSLGVFAGGFTLEAVEAVCSPDGGIDVFSGLEALLHNSLIRQVRTSGEEPRFDMLQTIRDYALEKSRSAGILNGLQQAHTGYFAGLAGGEMAMGVFGADSMAWLQRIREEVDNFRAALEWALTHEEGYPAAVTIMNPLTWFWFRYGHLHEGREWTERAVSLATDQGDTQLRAMALLGRSYMALWTGDLVVATETAHEALEISERIGFDYGISMAKLSYGVTMVNRGRDRAAYPHLVDAIELYDQQGLTWMKGTALVHLGNVSLGMGDFAQAQKWLDMARPFMEASGDPWNLAFMWNNFGEVARARGDYPAAETYYRRTEALFEQADAVGDQARLVHTFGYIALHKGDFEEARRLFYQSLADFRKLGNHRGIAECLAGLACLAGDQGQPGRAARLLGAAEKQLADFGGAWWPADRVVIERCRSEISSGLAEDFDGLWEQGQRMGIEEAVRFATTAPNGV